MTGEESSAERWPPGSLLQGALDATEPRLWRLVWVERADVLPTAAPGEACEGWGHVLEVLEGVTPQSSALPQRLALSSLQACLAPVPECLRSADMDKPDEEIDQADRDKRDEKFALIGPLIEPQSIGELLAHSTRPARLAARAEECGVRIGDLRLLLTRCWWFGGDRNALLPLHSRKGGPGRERMPTGPMKRGRRNAVAEDDPDSKYRGVNYDEHHREKFKHALQLYWTAGMSLSQAYGEMCENLYRTKVQLKNGDIIYRHTPPHRIPTKRVFYDKAPRLIAELGIKQKNLGPLDYAENEAPKTGTARDISVGPGDVFDTDSTEFNFELVASFDVGLRLGKPLVYLVADRSSSCIVGLYVEIGAERWEGYRRALFNAFTPKTQMAQWLGIEHDGPILDVHAIPNTVFADRGPMRGKDAWYALCDRMRIGKATSPPHRPDWNAIVESLHKKFQEQLSKFAGGYTRNPGERAKTRHNEARKNAEIDEQQFIRLIFAAAHDHNVSADMSLIATPAMGRIVAVPRNIFKWGLRNSPVDRRRFINDAEIYALLLPSRKDARVTNKGVKYDKMYYWSPELEAWRQRQTARRPTIEFHFDVDPQIVYWRPEAGQWRKLVMRAEDQAKTKNMTWSDIDAYFKRQRQIRITAQPGIRRKKVLSRTGEAVVRESAARRQENPAGAMSNEAVRPVREVARAARQRENAAAGRAIMDGLTGQSHPAGSPPSASDAQAGKAPPSKLPSAAPEPQAATSAEPPTPSSCTGQTKKANSRTPLAQLRKRFFKTETPE